MFGEGPLEPPIADPQLLERLAMDDARFAAYLRELAPSVPQRTYGPEVLERALSYPWERPEGSFRMTPAGAEPLAGMSPAVRDAAIAEYSGAEGRTPLLAIGSNGAPAVLRRKFAHFEEDADRSLLVLSGRLAEFDVGFSAQPALYGSLPATIFPSPGTAVRAAVLWLTPAQFTQLAWSELSYRLGALATRFEVDEGGAAFDEVLVFASRFGAFCVEGEPVAQAAVPASGRRARALTQEQVLDAAAALALGPEARAEDFVRALFEDLPATLPKLAAVNRETQRLSSSLWTPSP